MKTKTHFAFRVDVWDSAANSIVEHIAGIDDFEVAEATYRAAVAGWPRARIALRQGIRVVARPTTVFLCALPDQRAKWSFNEMLFMCWTRETGVIPAALAGLLLGMEAPGAQMITSVTFIAVLMTILIQAPTTKWLASKLKLLEERKKGR